MAVQTNTEDPSLTRQRAAKIDADGLALALREARENVETQARNLIANLQDVIDTGRVIYHVDTVALHSAFGYLEALELVKSNLEGSMTTKVNTESEKARLQNRVAELEHLLQETNLALQAAKQQLAAVMPSGGSRETLFSPRSPVVTDETQEEWREALEDWECHVEGA